MRECRRGTREHDRVLAPLQFDDQTARSESPNCCYKRIATKESRNHAIKQ